MAVVNLQEVQQWLEATKMPLAAVDPELADSAATLAFGKVSTLYDITEWTSRETTPKLVRVAISMLIAAWEYQRAYGEEEDSTYGRRRERQALELLDDIASGSTILAEYPEVGVASGEPVFYPNDTSNASEVYDAQGNYIAAGDDVKFRMAGGF